MNSWMHILRRLFAVALAVAGATVLVPAAATPARDDVVSWTSPTPGEGAVLGVAAKTTLSFRLGCDLGWLGRHARDPGLGRLAAGRGAPARGWESGERDVHVEAPACRKSACTG